MQNPKRFRKQCGAIALPGKKPGCVCIVGIIDTLEIYLLGEFESRDCRELVQKCFYFDETIYGEKRWLADADHIALKDVLYEMNEGRVRGNGIYPATPETIRGKYEQPYLYLLPEIKKLRDSERRLLHLDDDSAVLRYMEEVAPDEMADLKLGAYPAIEALAFAAIEVIQVAKAGQYDYNDKADRGVQTEDLLSLD